MRLWSVLASAHERLLLNDTKQDVFRRASRIVGGGRHTVQEIINTSAAPGGRAAASNNKRTAFPKPRMAAWFDPAASMTAAMSDTCVSKSGPIESNRIRHAGPLIEHDETPDRRQAPSCSAPLGHPKLST
jgi:hypothetical protein